jgi:hypothetical protein
MLAKQSELRAMLALLGFLFAVVLSMRFNMFILFLGILASWVLLIFVGLTNHSSASAVALQIVLAAVILQVGYVAGIVMRWTLLASRRGHWPDRAATLVEVTKKHA